MSQVISQKHEIHAIPVENATNSTDEQPVTELQEINEIGLSKLLQVNLSQDAYNETDEFPQVNLLIFVLNLKVNKIIIKI